MNNEKQLFEKLRANSDYLSLNPSLDNEAMRHDLLVYPFLKSGLGWSGTDLCSQRNIEVPQQVIDSHIFRNSTPKHRTPDIVVAPADIPITLLVLEEKKRQNSIAELNKHRVQLHEYQSLFESVWGILTDGEKWILKRNFENYHVFDGIDELEYALKDIQHAIGKQQMLGRYKETGSIDLLNVIYMPPSQISIPSQSMALSNSFQNEIILEALKFQEQYSELFRSSPVSMDNLVNRIGNDYFKKGIKVSVVNARTENIKSMSIIQEESAEIVVSGELNQCWKRYSVTKELFHLVLSRSDYFSPKLESTAIEQAMFALSGGNNLDSSAARSECAAEIMAMSTLIPTSKWHKLDEWINKHGASTYELAHWFRIPEQKLQMYISMIYTDAKSLFQIIKYLGAK